MTLPLFHIILHEPEIPNNTGNIGRTCIATRCGLHLIRPLGFDTSEKALRRAGLDYWPRLGVIEHEDWDTYRQAHASARRWFLTTKAARTIWQADLCPGDHLVFGKETSGLPEPLLAEHPERCIVLPMATGERSLNLATAVCAVIYEGLRQCVSRGNITIDAGGRITLPA